MDYIPRRRILLFADDDVVSRFHHFGLEIICAASSRAGFDLLDAEHFDAIVIDPHAQIFMTCKDPLCEVSKHIGSMALLVLASEEDSEIPSLALQAGASAVFNKDRLDPAIVGRFFGLDARTERQARRLLTSNRKLRREIHHRQAVESALRRTEEKYRNIFENAPIGIFRAYMLGGFEQVNPTLATMLGYDSADDLMESVCDVGHDVYSDPDLRDMILEQALRAPGKVIVSEVDYKKKDGSTFPVSVRLSTVPNPMGPPYLVEGTVEDLSERRKAEAALQKSERKHKELVENLRVGIYSSTVGTPGKFLTVNPAMAELFGYSSPEELLATPPADLYVSDGDRADVIEHILRNHHIRQNEVRLRKKNGEVFWAAGSVTVNTDEHGNIISIDGIVEDVSTRKRAEIALRKAFEDAEEASRLKSDFLSLMSHELRTPLTSILGFTKVLSKKLEHAFLTQPDGFQACQSVLSSTAQGLSIIESEGDRLTVLINDVIDLAQLEAGSMTWNMGYVDIRSILMDCVMMRQMDFEEKGIHLETKFPDSLPSTIGDSKRLQQVISSLLSNALKFTDAGCVTVTANVVDNKVWVNVVDTGIGMDVEARKDIFDAFKQVGDILTDKPHGIGLGLALCRKIVEYHGGILDVTSMPGMGSVFTFSLPLQA